MAQDPYQELGVSKTASAEDIQKAFRKLAKTLHPDQNPGNKAAEERFKRVVSAFDILRDPEKRRKFDRGQIDADGHERFQQAGRTARPQGSPFGAGQFEGADLNDIFEMFGAGSRGGPRGGAQGPMGGFAGGFGQKPQKGSDIKLSLEVDLLDTIVGNTRRIVLKDGRTIDVNIPKACQDGQTLRLKGQGAASVNGGSHGDALIEIKIKPHPIFKRDGHDLHMDLFISLPDCVLGGKVEAPTPDGPVTITIPKKSNSGAMLRLKSRGGFDPKASIRGDLYVRLILSLPESYDDSLIELAQDWRDNGPNAAQSNGFAKK